MIIYYDQSEGREGTRLPENVIEAGIRVVGLERMTGADLLVTREDSPSLPAKLVDLVPHRIALGNACKGGLLVSRATGGDAAGHITDLGAILVRMQEWSDLFAHMVVGSIWRGQGEELVVDGVVTGYSYNSFAGSLISFQADGGIVGMVPDDGCVLPWLEGWGKRLGEKGKVKSKTKARGAVPSGGSEQVRTLMSLPRVGAKYAKDLFEKFGSLASCLEWLSHPELYDPDFHSGLGKKDLGVIQDWLGLRPGQKISVDTIYEEGFPVQIEWPKGLSITNLKYSEGEYDWTEMTRTNKIYWSSNKFVLVIIPAMSNQALEDVFAKIKISPAGEGE